MSSNIKNDLLNLQKYLLVGETSSSSTKVAKEMRNKYQKKKEIQGDESANLILRLSVTNALHNKRVIYRQCCILS